MNFVVEKIHRLTEELKQLMMTKHYDITDFDFTECGYKIGSDLPEIDESWSIFRENMTVCGIDKHFWFHKKIRTPKTDKDVFLKLITKREQCWDVTNPQCIVYLNGEIAQGADVNHTDIILKADEEYEIYVYFYTARQETPLEFSAYVYELDKDIYGLYYDLRVPLDCCRLYDKGSEPFAEIMSKLDIAVGFLDLRKPYSSDFYDGVQNAQRYLAENLYDRDRSISKGSVSCIGHTHIDVAWLWTVRQTREKVQRSFATVISLMERYPEFKFISSQPVLYKFVKEEAPDLYEKIRAMAAAGRWEAEGGMWLEADCNMTSGESLVRQLLYGKSFMKEELGVDNKILWLPDVFGYSAALPQILRKSGIDKFVTAKITWNDTNKMPYDTFIWEGLDGSQVLADFLTIREYHNNVVENDRETTYVGQIKPDQILGAWKRYQHKELNDEVLFSFGWGDGGGGPTEDMLEQQRRLGVGLPGMPKTEIKTVKECLEKIEENFLKNTAQLSDTPKWVGELYLELHRGTYTSMAANKKNNRKCEFLYQTIEYFSVINRLFDLDVYPEKELRAAWEKILLNQFHDILPGSAIEDVYKVCDTEYAKLRKCGDELLERMLNNLVNAIKTQEGVVVFNPNSFSCSDIIKYDGAVYTVYDVPAYGWKVIKPKETKETIAITKNMIENRFYRMTLDEHGEISSLFDKEACREVIAEGKTGNALEVFEDYPYDYDAWEISEYYKYKMWKADDLQNIEIFREGAGGGLKITRKYLNSTITQKIYMYTDNRRIDFVTDIDWHEEHSLIKATFPVNVRNTNAVYDIQFGNIERPTHRNTDWDKAKFEVCAHKWADLSEDNYGVSLLNDCKYGYSIEDNVIKLTLLKCATYPNPNADKGRHQFTYSLYPHSGDFKTGGTVHAAYALNKPLIAVKNTASAGELETEYSLMGCSEENIIIDTIKLAEDGNGLIVRMYEAYNRKTRFTVNASFRFKEVYLCDLMENCVEKLENDGNKITANAGNYEILTFRFVV